jgi:hypothetical protein
LSTRATGIKKFPPSTDDNSVHQVKVKGDRRQS